MCGQYIHHHSPGWTEHDYFRGFIIAGELTRDAMLYINIGELIERAIFLRDSVALRYYAGHYSYSNDPNGTRSSIFLQSALETGDPAIMSIILALMVGTRKLSHLFPIDPRPIVWTPGLRWYYGNVCNTFLETARYNDLNIRRALTLAGHLHLWPVKYYSVRWQSERIRYLGAYVRNNTEKLTVQSAEKICSANIAGFHILPSGIMFASNDRAGCPLIAAMEILFPEAIRELVFSGYRIERSCQMRFPEYISRNTVDDARQILSFLTAELAGRSGIPLNYLIYLRVICGERISEIYSEEGDLAEECLAAVIGASGAVMHPDVDPYRIKKPFDDIGIPTTNIHYDPLSHISDECSYREDSVAYKYGLGWSCRETPELTVSLSQAIQCPVRKLLFADDIRLEEEIMKIEAAADQRFPNHDGLLTDAHAFDLHIRTFYQILTQE